MFVCFINVIQHIMLFALRLEKSSFPRPLNKKEEKECFKKIKENNYVAREILIKHNLRLVAHIVKKYYSTSADQDDLISIGTVGLIKAVKSYDYEKKIKFATYASRCIENEILMYFRQVRKNVNTVCLDSSNYFNNSKIYLYSNDLVEENDILEIVDLRCKSSMLYELINKILSLREKSVLIYRYGLYKKTLLT